MLEGLIRYICCFWYNVSLVFIDIVVLYVELVDWFSTDSRMTNGNLSREESKSVYLSSSDLLLFLLVVGWSHFAFVWFSLNKNKKREISLLLLLDFVVVVVSRRDEENKKLRQRIFRSFPRHRHHFHRCRLTDGQLVVGRSIGQSICRSVDWHSRFFFIDGW